MIIKFILNFVMVRFIKEKKRVTTDFKSPEEILHLSNASERYYTLYALTRHTSKQLGSIDLVY